MLLLDVLAAAVAKVASASTVVQVAAGLGITVAGVTGAGAAGVLPGPVQDGVASAIEAVTPFAVPHSADPAAHPTRRTDDDVVPPSPTTVPARPTTTAPATSTGATEVEAEDDGGVHQHPDGEEAAVAVPTDAVEPTSGRDHAEDDGPATPSTTDTPEVEDDHGGGSGEDSSGHGGRDD